MSNTGQAWVTLATNDSYALGALVLAQSLKRNNTIHQLAVLVTPGVSQAMREALSSVFDLVKEVDVLDSQDAANLALMARPDLGVTFTKLHCWKLTQYSKCVFLDADTLVIKNSDELFERDELSAAPDAGWPDCFNSGVFVFTPSETTFNSLLDFALTHGSFDGGDQGLLNMYFGDWATKDITKHLPFVYNMVATATYSYLPAFKAFGGNVKIAHFIGSSKPWLQALPSGSTLSSFLDLWWDIFLKDVSKKLNSNMGGLAGALAGGQRDVIEDQFRKQSWEQGNIDYMGKDAFENIWKKISETVEDIKPPEILSAPEESAPALETPKTEDKSDPSKAETQQASAPPAETRQPAVEQPQQEVPKAEISETTSVNSAVEPSKPQDTADAPRADETQKLASELEAAPALTTQKILPGDQSVAAPIPEAEEATIPVGAENVSVAPTGPVTTATAEPAAAESVTAATAEPSAVEPLPAASTEPGTDAPAPVSTPEPAAAAPVSTPEPAAAASVPEPAAILPVPAPTPELAVSTPTVAPPQPPTPTVEPPTPPILEPAKDLPSPPPADIKASSPPKDEEKRVQEPDAPASPSMPSPASPSAPEGAKTEAASAPLPPDSQTAETSIQPQTPLEDAPVPPKRSSKKGKAKK